MIHPKIISIIQTSKTALQLDSCEKFCEGILKSKSDYEEAIKTIKTKRSHLQITGIKNILKTQLNQYESTQAF